MLFEILSSSIMLGLAGVGHYYKTNSINETKKILLIAERAGFYKNDDKLRIYRGLDIKSLIILSMFSKFHTG